MSLSSDWVMMRELSAVEVGKQGKASRELSKG